MPSLALSTTLVSLTTQMRYDNLPLTGENVCVSVEVVYIGVHVHAVLMSLQVSALPYEVEFVIEVLLLHW